ncbi:hypothetical protein PGUG_00512 [Meyerozyma guilliermondii ATCC 6260]|uniref:Uncharacterized protein n=1 Tax=Meyerozyma guilliermondii (strain ATCC 6260 / CBS 566 / DSM 6381 / JCM 1539 / NBRC 10279 / NRRL Y-324) TaxID=294746 RepID=A5DB57_PICGU|nr:uncharacterized protein PGUG_00512 [Meyerozyma guilliermondii ATCC 6260]EDK36414.2 hypothetical protein PGUG_00512 [Meyerozyma guilliermondii ATCC 6260]
MDEFSVAPLYYIPIIWVATCRISHRLEIIHFVFASIMSDTENQEYSEEVEYVDANEVDEEVVDDGRPEDIDDDMDEDDQMGDDEAIEIDMSNNSWSYFDQHKDSIFCVFKHPTLPLVATGGGDNTAFLWTTHSQPPRFVGELTGHKESVVAGSFTADGKFVVSGDMTGFIQVHKSQKGGQKWTKCSELEEVEEVLWIQTHPVLPIFAFGANDGSVWCYQIDQNGQLEQLFSGFSHTLECNNGQFIETADAQNDVQLVTVAEDGTVINWNAFTGTVNYKLSPDSDFKNVESPFVSIKAHKNIIAVGGRDGQLVIINNDSGKVVHTVKVLEDVEDQYELSLEALAWCQAPSVNLLAVGLVSGDVILFDTLQWRVRSSFKVDDAITKLQFIEQTPFLVGSSMNGRIYKWDARTGAEVFVGMGHNMGVLDFAILENGSKFVTAGDEGVSLVFVPTA